MNISGTETITTGTGTATTTTTTNGSISLNGIDGSLTTTGDATIGGGITIGQYGAPTLGGKDGYLEIVGSTITGDEGAVYMGIVDDATDPNYRSSYVSADMLDTTNLNIYNKNTGDLAFSVDGTTGNITNEGTITAKGGITTASTDALTGTTTYADATLGDTTVNGDITNTGTITSEGLITANGGLTVKDGESLTLGGKAVNAIDDGTSGVVPFATTPTASTTLATVATVKNATSSLSAGLGNLNYSSTNYIKAGDNLTKAVSALDSNLYRLEEDVDEMNKEMKAGFASVAALSALQPNARAFNDTQISMGVGNYRGQTGFALGGFHYVNDNLMMNVGAAYAGDHSATFRGGLTFGW